MCTALSVKKKTGTYLFGRNMDIEYYFNQSPMVVPRNYTYKNYATGNMEVNKYALMGMGVVVDELPLFAEVQNEKGLSCAGLNFPDAVWENECKEGYNNMPPYNFPLWVVGNYGSTQEVIENIGNISLVGVPVNTNLPLPTLHFMVCDKIGKSIVVEFTKNGVQVYDNKVGVMTNAPDFPWHLTNLRNYLNISSHDLPDTYWGEQGLYPLGTGTGLRGLPGDFSSVSRFVRSAFLRNSLKISDTKSGDVNAFFHILDNVAMVKGAVITQDNHVDYTSYASCMDLQEGKYYFKTYDNQCIRMIDMYQVDLDGGEIIEFPYECEEVYENIKPV